MFMTPNIILATIPAQHIPDNPYANILAGLLIIAIGGLLFIYRHPIGEFTGYYVGRGKLVDKPTPGCLLNPFAVAIIAGGLLLVIKSIQALFGG